MIPLISRCQEDGVEPACPHLFEDLDAVKGTALAAVLNAVTPSCQDDLESFVSLNPIAFGDGNYVAVLLENVSRVQSKVTNMPIGARNKVSAVVLGVFTGYPVIEQFDDGAFLPEAAQYHAAAKFVLGLSWCVWCALTEAANDNTLFSGSGCNHSVTFGPMESLDFDGGQAGFKIAMSWLDD